MKNVFSQKGFTPVGTKKAQSIDVGIKNNNHNKSGNKSGNNSGVDINTSDSKIKIKPKIVDRETRD
jgi:hypothetical protein